MDVRHVDLTVVAAEHRGECFRRQLWRTNRLADHRRQFAHVGWRRRQRRQLFHRAILAIIGRKLFLLHRHTGQRLHGYTFIAFI
jgi:hypothetical protein